MRIDDIDRLYETYRSTLINSRGWSSSAQQLDDEIAARGYKIREKFFHQYYLPEPNAVLEKTSERVWLYAFPGDRLEKIGKALGKNIVLSADLRENLELVKAEVINLINKYAKLIQDKNPGLRGIELKRLIDKIHFIRGAAYGYPPENIEFWIQNYPDDATLNQADGQRRALRDKFGIDAGLMRLTVPQANKLLSELSAQIDKKALLQNAAGNLILENNAMRDLMTTDPFMAWKIEHGMMND